MKNEDLEKTLSRMLAAVGADAEPALLTRARARIAARAGRPFLVRWAMRPAALGASMAIFLASAGLSFALVANTPDWAGGESASLIESLLEEEGVDDGAIATPPAAPGSASDSGGAR